MVARLALVVAVSLLVACAAAPEADAPPLRVASDLDNPPFASLDAEGRPVGRDVEMMEQLGRALGRPIEWVRLPFASLVPALEADEADVVCATFGVTGERAQRVAYTRPYFRTSIAVVVPVGEGEPRTLVDLAGRRVAAAPGTTSERAVRLRLPRSTGVFEAEDERSTAERLLTGAVDAAVMDAPAAEALVAEHPGRLARLRQTLGAELYALAVPLGRDELLVALDSALEALDRSGGLRKLDARFGLASAR